MIETVSPLNGDGPRIPIELYEAERWYACRTRSRAEKQVEVQLSRQGWEAYLPLAPEETRWQDRKKTVMWPMFRGYVFGRFALRSLHRVLATPGLTSVVKTAGIPTPIGEEDLENVRRFAELLARHGGLKKVKAEPLLEVGQKVLVVDGYYKGIHGWVKQVRGRRRVLIGLKQIGQAVTVNIPLSQVKTVKAESREVAP